MLIDTSGWLCLFDKSNSQHDAAVGFEQAATRRVTQNYVLDEFVVLAQVRGMPRAQALEYMTAVLDDPRVQVFWVEEVLHRAALELLKRRPDKKYSLCDAVSFELMRQQRITNALTTDKHFAQEGFVRLLEGPQ